MFYDKKIKYLNYIVDGERLKGCGFVKVELRDETLNMEVSVTGLPASFYGEADVWLCINGDKISLGKIYLENGSGKFCISDANVKDVCPIGMTYEEWEGVVIFPGEGWEISGAWERQHERVLERVEVSKELVVPKIDADIINREEIKMPEDREETKVEYENQPIKKSESNSDVLLPKEMEQKNEDMHEAEVGIQQMRPAEDKWEQISGIYPHVRPFRDKREYLSIRPADFVLLSEASYKAVNNSFLLHGYHNYQHLILARAVKKGEISYYVGAPGNFYEREKQVAIMFGFTGFECAKDPAREGDFGYYLMEVQL